jgi:hypothetical protein
MLRNLIYGPRFAVPVTLADGVAWVVLLRVPVGAARTIGKRDVKIM